VTLKSARHFLMERKWVWVGMEGMVVTGELAEIFNVPGGSGLLVKVVPKGSPAWEMALQGGDRTARLGTMPAGQSFKASVLRAGRVIELTGKVP
jgi:S1-C subfamily serine protease